MGIYDQHSQDKQKPLLSNHIRNNTTTAKEQVHSSSYGSLNVTDDSTDVSTNIRRNVTKTLVRILRKNYHQQYATKAMLPKKKRQPQLHGAAFSNMELRQ